MILNDNRLRILIIFRLDVVSALRKPFHFWTKRLCMIIKYIIYWKNEKKKHKKKKNYRCLKIHCVPNSIIFDCIQLKKEKNLK